jgi:hypothetical protein
MSRRVSLAPTNVRHDADRLHPLRRTRIEILHILLEHSYDSQRNENGAQLADVIGGSKSREARICSVRSDSRRVAVVGSVAHTSSRRIRAASWRCLAAAIVARSTRGTGMKPYPAKSWPNATTQSDFAGVAYQLGSEALQ